MYTIGIFDILPENGQTPVTGSWPDGVFVRMKTIDVPMVARAGWLEIINKSPYDLQVNIMPGGAIVQEAGSKCIYKLVNGGQGLQIIVQPPNSTAGTILTNVLLTGANNTVIVNHYEENEQKWYAPVSLSSIVPPVQQQFGYLNYQTFSQLNVTTAAPLNIPASTAAQQIWLLGFDVSINPNATTATHILTLSGIVSNYFQTTNNTLVWQIFCNSTNASQMTVRFPVPILVGPSGAAFTPSVTFPTNLSINVYWLVQ